MTFDVAYGLRNSVPRFLLETSTEPRLLLTTVVVLMLLLCTGLGDTALPMVLRFVFTVFFAVLLPNILLTMLLFFTL